MDHGGEVPVPMDDVPHLELAGRRRGRLVVWAGLLFRDLWEVRARVDAQRGCRWEGAPGLLDIEVKSRVRADLRWMLVDASEDARWRVATLGCPRLVAPVFL